MRATTSTSSPKSIQIELLGQLAPKVVTRHPEESRALVIELGRLPLAIQVAGRLLAAEAGRGGLGVTELLDDIRKGAALFKAKAPPGLADLVHETTPTVLALLMKSVDCLDAETKGRFPYLAPFVPKPASFDLAGACLCLRCRRPKAHRARSRRFRADKAAETEGRYHTHAIITKLVTYLAKGDTTPWLKHSTCYALLVCAANKTYRKGNEGVLHGLATFNIEWDNIEAGQRWAVVNAETNDSIARMCVDYALGCPDLLSLRLHPREQVLWLESALQCARHLKDRRNERRSRIGQPGQRLLPAGRVSSRNRVPRARPSDRP